MINNDLLEKFKQIDVKTIKIPDKNIPIPDIKVTMPDIPPNPVIETNKLLSEQIVLLKAQNEELRKQAETAKDDAVKSKKYNKIMMIIAIVAMLAAIVSPIVTVLVSR